MSSRPLIIFLAGMPLSFAYNSYNDAKGAMYRYRNNKLDEYDKRRFYNEESYVKHRVFSRISPNILMASIWPLSFPMNSVPSIARFMNPQNDESTK